MVRKALLCSLLTVLALPVSAQTMENRLRTQLAAVTAQLHDLQNAQTTLTAQKLSAEHERDQLKDRLATAEQRARTVQRQAHPVPAPPAADTANYKQQIDTLTRANATLAAEKDRALKQASSQEADLAACRVKNAEAIKIASELLVAYHSVGIGDLLGRNEPLTGLNRVKFEQLEQEFGDRIYNAQSSAQPVRPAEVATPSKK